MKHVRAYHDFIYESYAHQGDIFFHIIEGEVPLTPTISRLLFDNKRVNAFHITDPNHASKMLRHHFRGKESLSCFSYCIEEIVKRTKITPYTLGGVLLHLEGDLLFSLNKDAMSKPDSNGRRWIDNWNFPTKFRAELNRWISSKGNGKELINLIKTEDKDIRLALLREYIPFIEGLVKKYAQEIKSVCDMYWTTDLTEGWPIDYNEIVLGNINIRGILINRPVFLKYESEASLLNIVEELELISGDKVEVIYREEDILQWFHERGGVTNYKEHVKGKELPVHLLTHIRRNVQ